MLQRSSAESHPDAGQLRGAPWEVHRRVRESGQLPPLHRLHPQRQEEGRDHRGDEEGKADSLTDPQFLVSICDTSIFVSKLIPHHC